MSTHTITIPADLWGGRQPRLLRRCADELERSLGRNPAVADLIDLARRLADEIERQAPREPGWYFVYRTDRAAGKFYHWNGKDWAQTESRSYSEPVGLAPGITAESVIFESGAS